MPDKPKRSKAVTMTQRSRKYLEKQGYICTLVERSVNAPKFAFGKPTGEMFRNKFDAWGFADLACCQQKYLQHTRMSYASETRSQYG